SPSGLLPQPRNRVLLYWAFVPPLEHFALALFPRNCPMNFRSGGIGAAIDVHRAIGPGLLESAYVQCLCYELASRKISFQLELPLPVRYKGLKLDCGYRIDLMVADSVVVEVKAVERIVPLHEAQLLTYLRLGGWRVGLLINFNVQVLREGIVRRVLEFEEW
ncbi:MAG TPA: GxxExxY protein, partial [Bryobacteraceae bacterium]